MSSPDSSVEMRLSNMNYTLLQSPTSSIISFVVMMIPTPVFASCLNRLYISNFVATSMPRVGSINRRTLNFVVNQRPTATFCWFPPLSRRTGALREGAFTSIFSTMECTKACERGARLHRCTCSPRTNTRSCSLPRSVQLTVLRICDPQELRKCPGRRASPGLFRIVLFPSISTDPVLIASRPKRLSKSCACPWP